MKTSPSRRSRIGIFALLSLIYLQTSCLEAEERPVNYGPEVDAIEVIRTLREPMGKMEHNQIGKSEKSEKTTYVYQPNIPNPHNYILQVEGKEILSKEKLADRYRYKSKIRVTTFENGKPVVNENDPEKGPYDDFALFDDGADQDSDTATYAIFNSLTSSGILNTLSASKTTFHQLEHVDGVSDLPSKVKNKTNCANMPDCKINIRTVTVVMVEWATEGPVRHDLKFIVSGQAPFFSKVLSQCNTWLNKNEKNGSLLITLCADTTDFDPGTTWP